MNPSSVCLRFLPDNIATTAIVGEPLLNVAERVGVRIPTGCGMGSCHACEVELDGERVCSCITAVPASPTEIIVDLYSDPPGNFWINTIEVKGDLSSPRP